jgi:hypothetical protein
VPCGTRPVMWMKDTTFKSCMTPDIIPPYVTDTDGPNQCSGAGERTDQLCGPYQLDSLTCDNLLPCGGATSPTTGAPQPLPAQTSAIVATGKWADYGPTCNPGTICRYASNPCELDAYWRDDCTCPEFNPIRYGFCRYEWSGDNQATCTCGQEQSQIVYEPVYYPVVTNYYSGYWCEFPPCGDNWGWDNCWRRPCRPICWSWGCPNYPWWSNRPRPPYWPVYRPPWWGGGDWWGCRHKGCPGWWGGGKPGCRGYDCVGGGEGRSGCASRG